MWLNAKVLFMGKGHVWASKRRARRNTVGSIMYMKELAHMHEVAEHKYAYDAYDNGRVSYALLLYMLRGEMGFTTAQTNAAFILSAHPGYSPPGELESPPTKDEVVVINSPRGRHRRQWRWTALAAQQADPDALLMLGDMFAENMESAHDGSRGLWEKISMASGISATIQSWRGVEEQALVPTQTLPPPTLPPPTALAVDELSVSSEREAMGLAVQSYFFSHVSGM